MDEDTQFPESPFVRDERTSTAQARQGRIDAVFTPVDVSPTRDVTEPVALDDLDTVQPLGSRAPLPHEAQADLVEAQRALEMISCHPDLDLGLTPAPLSSPPTDDADIDYGAQRIGRLNFGRNGIDEVEYARGQFELGLIALGDLLGADVSHDLGYDEYPEFINRELQAENAAFAIMKMRYLVERNGELPRGARPTSRVSRHEREAIYDAVAEVQTNPDGWREELQVVVRNIQALDRHLEVLHNGREHDHGF